MQSDISNLEMIISYCEKIEDAIHIYGDDIEDFISNDHYVQSCAFSMIQIGESVKRLSPDIIKSNNSTPWSQIARFRDFLAHNYARLEPISMWNTLNEDIPVLKADCQRILSDLCRD